MAVDYYRITPMTLQLLSALGLVLLSFLGWVSVSLLSYTEERAAIALQISAAERHLAAIESSIEGIRARLNTHLLREDLHAPALEQLRLQAKNQERDLAVLRGEFDKAREEIYKYLSRPRPKL